MGVAPNNAQEVLLTNVSATTGGPRSNVVALKHTHVNGSAAIRLLRQSDGHEVGAVGFQNGGAFYLPDYVFLAGTAPYDPNTGALTGTPSPSGVALGQEGYYDGAARFVRRIDIQPDWAIVIRDPLGNPILTIDPTGFVDYHARTEPPAPPDGRARMYCDAVGSVQRLMVVFPNGERKVLAEESS